MKTIEEQMFELVNRPRDEIALQEVVLLSQDTLLEALQERDRIALKGMRRLKSDLAKYKKSNKTLQQTVSRLQLEKTEVARIAREEGKYEANQEMIETIGDWPYATREEYARFKRGEVIKWRTVREALTDNNK